MKWYSVISLGALGGMCPTVAKLAAFYSSNPTGPMPELGVYIGLALFALLGSIVAMGFGAKEARAAIVAGIAAPAIVTNVIAGAEKKPIPLVINEASTETQTSFLDLSLISSAHAQTVSSSVPSITSTVTDNLNAQLRSQFINITPQVVGGGVPAVGSVTYEWADAQGAALGASFAANTLDPVAPQNVAVPEGAAGLTINGQFVPLPQAENEVPTLNLEIQTKPTLAGDLIWALGGDRTYAVESVQVAPMVTN